jgi:RNA polymerase sigma-70 factor (ECF subfamily)
VAPESAVDERSDVALLAATGEGDRTALETLYRRHMGWLYLRLARRCADPGLVEEAVQDTFLAVWQQAARFRGEGDVGAWLWGIGIRRLIDRLRRQPAPAHALADAGGDEPAIVSVEEQVLMNVQYGDVGAALDRLSPELRAVLQATVIDGLNSREAARLLGIPAGTVRTRLARAKAQMREALA